MDPRTLLRRRVGDTPLLTAPRLSEVAGLPNLRLKMEGANPTGTQKDRVARLEVAEALQRKSPGISVASCGNFGVAVAHAAYLHDLPCKVFIPADFQGERVQLMQDLGAAVERVPGTYEDAVRASRTQAGQQGWADANPGGTSTLRTLTGYANIAREILERMGEAPVVVGVPIGNGSTLAGVHLGFRTAWARGDSSTPIMVGGTSRGNNPLPMIVARGQDTASPLDPRSIEETPVNEPLVNWDALDAHACLTAIRDSGGTAYGHTDDELLELHAALMEDGIDAHPASLAAVAALRSAVEDGLVDAQDPMVAVLTSGRPRIIVERVPEPADEAAFMGFVRELQTWLGRYGDPLPEMKQAVHAAFTDGFVLAARDTNHVLGYCVLTPMELSEFFPKYHLSYIATHPEARGRGVGTVLLEEAVRATDGALSLHVETDNEPAIKLYEKFGFQRKYYRMLYRGTRTPDVDPARGAGWDSETLASLTEKKAEMPATVPR